MSCIRVPQPVHIGARTVRFRIVGMWELGVKVVTVSTRNAPVIQKAAEPAFKDVVESWINVSFKVRFLPSRFSRLGYEYLRVTSWIVARIYAQDEQDQYPERQDHARRTPHCALQGSSDLDGNNEEGAGRCANSGQALERRRVGIRDEGEL